MQRGFTLIELVIVVAIVGILATIALPSYREQMRKSVRAEAASFLSDVASRQQQFLVDKRRYATSLTELAMPAPTDLAGKFTFNVDAGDGPPPTFTLTGAAAGDQTHDACPTLTLDAQGTRAPTNCW